jgi:hypothetical protein
MARCRFCPAPIVRSHSAPLPEAPRDESRQVLLAETLIEGRPLLVANTHLAWRLEMMAERKAQVAHCWPRSNAIRRKRKSCPEISTTTRIHRQCAWFWTAAQDFTMPMPTAARIIPALPGRAKIHTSIHRCPETSALTTYLRPAISRRRIARSSSTAATASTSRPIISASFAISPFAGEPGRVLIKHAVRYVRSMSIIPSKTDIRQRNWQVRFVPEAGIPTNLSGIREHPILGEDGITFDAMGTG